MSLIEAMERLNRHFNLGMIVPRIEDLTLAWHLEFIERLQAAAYAPQWCREWQQGPE